MAEVEALPPPAVARPAAPLQLPAHAWPATDPLHLAAELGGTPWTLVEFWGPDNLFCRLMAPVRRLLPQSHGQRLRLLCCVVTGEAQLRACAAYGIRGLPELGLYRGARCVRRWRGAQDVHVLRHDIDAVLDRAPA